MKPEPSQPIKVLHITDQLSKGGAGRALIALAKYSRRLGNFQHECISVKPPFDGVISEGVTEGLPVHVSPSRDEIRSLIERADIVQWHWWQDFPLMREDLPRKPTIVWCAVSGEYPPNELTREVVDFADIMVITNPMTRDLPAIRSLPENERQRKVKVIFESADFERILPVEKIPHDTFNVGWIGTLAPGKYNRRYIEMSSRIALPNVRFIICGEGPMKGEAMEEARRLKTAERFHFVGYQDDMRRMFGLFDVYGFPLDEKTFAGGELNLQEAMAAGLPIVIFPYGGPKRMILHNYNGLIAYSEEEYREYIEYLYYHPEERKRLGDNARDYALREYGAENAAKKYNRLYVEMLQAVRKSAVVNLRRESPGQSDSRKRLALFHQGQGNFDKAERYARQHLADFPDDGEMLRLLDRVQAARVMPDNPLIPELQSAEVEKFIDTRIYPSYKVTAIVSTYKSEEVFLGCLLDLFEQTLYKKGDLEIIVVDSASPEKEWTMVEDECRTHKHVLALRTKTRESLYAAWNRAIRLATGEYLTNANTDDRHRKDALEVLAKALDDHPEVAVVYGDSWKTNLPGEIFDKNSAQDALRWGEYSPEKLEHHCCVGPHPMWRRSLHDEIGYFDERYRSAADYDFWLRVSLKYPLLHLDEMLGLYFHNPDSLGNAGMRVHQERIEVQRRHQIRKQRLQAGKPARPMTLDQCGDTEEIEALLKEKSLDDLFPDLFPDSQDNPESKGTAYLRVASRLLQLNDLAGARKYLQRSYDTFPLKQTRELIEKITDASPEAAARERKPSVGHGKTKILYVANSFPPHSYAGTELHTLWLAQEMTQRGYEPEILYPVHQPSEPAYSITERSFENLPVAELNLPHELDRLDGFCDEEAGRVVAEFVEQRGADIVHFQHLIGVSAAALEHTHRSGFPALMTVHDGWLMCGENHFVYPDGSFCSGPETPEKCADCIIARNPGKNLTQEKDELIKLFALRGQYLLKSYKLIDTVIVASQYTKNRLLTFGFDHPRIRLVPNGIPSFQPMPHQQSEGRVRFTFMGHIFFTKGVDLLINAFNLVPAEKAELNLWGSIPDRGYFDAVLAEVSEKHRVSYRGTYTPELIPAILANSDVVVVPSRSESFSYTVREAFHAGVPVVAAAVGGIPEAVRDGENGLLFAVGEVADLAEKLRFFAENPERIPEFKARIKPVMTMDEYGDHLEAIYREVLKRRRHQFLSAPERAATETVPMNDRQLPY